MITRETIILSWQPSSPETTSPKAFGCFRNKNRNKPKLLLYLLPHVNLSNEQLADKYFSFSSLFITVSNLEFPQVCYALLKGDCELSFIHPFIVSDFSSHLFACVEIELMNQISDSFNFIYLFFNDAGSYDHYT